MPDLVPLTTSKVLVYGANGTIGTLVTERLLQNGIRPILAGRTANPIVARAREHELETRIFNANAEGQMPALLRDVLVVINCARLAPNEVLALIRGCSQTGSHYCDVSTSLQAAEEIFKRSQMWQKAGIAVLPGINALVLPADFLAGKLKTKLPDTTDLVLGFMVIGCDSSFPALCSFMGELSLGGHFRTNSQLQSDALASETHLISFQDQQVLAVDFPFANLATSWYTTRVPNIRTVIAASVREVHFLRILQVLRWFLVIPWAAKLVRNILLPAHTLALSQKMSLAIWGQATNFYGKKVSMRLTISNYPDFLCSAVLQTVRRLSDGIVPPGAHSAAQLFGAEFFDQAEPIVLETINEG